VSQIYAVLSPKSDDSLHQHVNHQCKLHLRTIWTVITVYPGTHHHPSGTVAAAIGMQQATVAAKRVVHSVIYYSYRYTLSLS
jgi:hypothetical protein